MELSSSFLVQRLHKPAKWSPFAFGGGLKNGGLSDEAVSVLESIFSPDYMGAAEYEFGVLPEALNRFVDKNLGEPKVTCMDIRAKGKKTFCVFREDLFSRKDVEQRVVDLLAGNIKPRDPLRADAYFTDDVDRFTPVAWFDLNNSIIFGFDMEMKDKLMELFTK